MRWETNTLTFFGNGDKTRIAYGGTGRVRVKIRQMVYTNLKGETMEKDVMNYNGFITS